jgi:hypothetical protein
MANELHRPAIEGLLKAFRVEVWVYEGIFENGMK